MKLYLASFFTATNSNASTDTALKTNKNKSQDGKITVMYVWLAHAGNNRILLHAMVFEPRARASKNTWHICSYFIIQMCGG